ncbi:glycosyltransferase family 39 protein [Nocardioides sp.]|uniref:glycosyltransferase family 39 protein n=1 Tax=Nocardioides sp. TaxID=35761 RepID=UPI0031FEB885
MVLLLSLTAVLYLWNLDVSGWANSYYSAAAQAGAQSWKAFFFGSLDSSNAITVDKPPLSLWPMALSVRVFGMSSWSVLVPQALTGVGTVWLLYAAVRHTTRSAGAGLLAGALFAITPVAVLMFRYNNPDAMLTLLVVGAGYATLRSLDSPRALRWLVLAGSLSGLGFLTKMLEAFLVLPALALTYAVFAAVSFRRRLVHLAAALGAVLVSGGWWVAVVDLWPASSRPYIGGSTDNSVLQLALGYNGLGRLIGSGTSVSPSAAFGATNIARISRTDIGGEITWFVPAALVLGLAGWLVVRARHDSRPRQAALMMWLGWLSVSTLTFAVMAGIFHSYYTITLAPALAALIAIGGWILWQDRVEHPTRTRRLIVAASVTTTLLSLGLLVTVGFSLAWVAIPVAAFGTLPVILLIRPHLTRHTTTAMAVWALVAGTLGSVAFSLSTVSLPHTGSGPMAGPDHGASTSSLVVSTNTWGGWIDAASTPAPDLVRLLNRDSGSYAWVAAALGARSASTYELATGSPVLAIGGYTGADPSPTLSQFQQWVHEGRIHYFLPGGTSGTAGGLISTWVANTFTPQTTAGFSYYDLSGPLR